MSTRGCRVIPRILRLYTAWYYITKVANFHYIYIYALLIWNLSNYGLENEMITQAGKGRTGLMVSCYLVYTGMLAERALQVYAEKRTTNNEGVRPRLVGWLNR